MNTDNQDNLINDSSPITDQNQNEVTLNLDEISKKEITPEILPTKENFTFKKTGEEISKIPIENKVNDLEKEFVNQFIKPGQLSEEIKTLENRKKELENEIKELENETRNDLVSFKKIKEEIESKIKERKELEEKIDKINETEVKIKKLEEEEGVISEEIKGLTE